MAVDVEEAEAYELSSVDHSRKSDDVAVEDDDDFQLAEAQRLLDGKESDDELRRENGADMGRDAPIGKGAAIDELIARVRLSSLDVSAVLVFTADRAIDR